jgi:dipeptidyl aminopeptidase/acylaminoacyl peptidase
MADGQQIGSWLVIPPEASAANPAPLGVFAHGTGTAGRRLNALPLRAS